MMRDDNPGVICLQETKLGDAPFNPGLNYDFYTSPPPPGDRAKGGAALIVKKSLQHSLLPLIINIQAVAVKVESEMQVTICCIYLPPHLMFTSLDLQNIINQIPTPFMILGDFNAHNPLWGGTTIDTKGKIVEDLLDTNSLVLLNDGTPTIHNVHSNSKSAIDLSICTPSIYLDFEWAVDAHLNGSGHFPIHSIFIRYSSNNETPPEWKVEEADWIKFNQDIILDRDFESFECHIDAYNYFVEQILNSATTSIPLSKGIAHRPPVPWWDKNCSVLRKVTRKYYKRYKNSGSPHCQIIYKSALA